MLRSKLAVLCLVAFSFIALFVYSYFFPSPGFYYVVSTLVFVSLFFAVYLVAYLSSGISAEFNKWVETVDAMTPWFNRMFDAWLFVKDRKRWAKRATVAYLFISFWFGVAVLFLLFRGYPGLSVWIESCLIGWTLTALSALAWYQRYS
ncbi:MAG: hypothetical protein QXM22_03040 [Candidatus Bathyarchaeia archaeon]